MSNGTNSQWQALGGDLSGSASQLTVTGLSGRTLSSTAPANGDTLRWDATLGVWQPATPVGWFSTSDPNEDGEISMWTATDTSQQYGFGWKAPAVARSSPLRLAGPATDPSGTLVKFAAKDTSNVSQMQWAVPGTDYLPPTGTTGSVSFQSASATIPWRSVATASIPASCSAGEGLFVSDADAGQQLRLCGPANTWNQVAYERGTSLPGSCSLGAVFFKTDTTAGRNLYFCTSSNTWTQMSGSTVSLPGSSGALLAADGTGGAIDSGARASAGTLSVGSSTAAGELKLYELTSNGTEYTGWLAPDSLSSILRYVLPSTAPTAGQVLTASAAADGNGKVTTAWSTLVGVSTSTSGPVSDPGGAAAIQWNNASGAITFNAPAGAAGYQRCYQQATGKSGAITVQMATSNTVDLNGTNSSSAGTLVSSGAAGDSVCIVSDTTNHWYVLGYKGTWSTT